MQVGKGVTLAAAITAALLSAAHSQAAVLNGTYTEVPAASGSNNYSGFVNFADEGTLDWVLWEYNTSSEVPGTPTLAKDAADYISDAYAIGGNGKLRGANGTDLEISTTPGAIAGQGRASAGAILNQSLKGQGAGIGLMITVPTTDLYVARIYVGGFRTQASPLTARLPGAADVVFTPTFLDGANNFKDAGIFELTFQADAVDGVSNVLEVTFTLNPTSDNSSHVLFQGATLIPEPSAISLLGFSALGLLRRRRTRCGT